MTLTAVELGMVELLIQRANDAQRRLFIEMIGASSKNDKAVAPVSSDAPLRVGDMVIFKGRKTKPPVIGRIKSMNDKTYTITECSDGGPGWRMPPSMLKRYVA